MYVVRSSFQGAVQRSAVRCESKAYVRIPCVSVSVSLLGESGEGGPTLVVRVRRVVGGRWVRRLEQPADPAVGGIQNRLGCSHPRSQSRGRLRQGMYVWSFACMYVCVELCMYIYIWSYAYMYVCMHIYPHVCMYMCMYVCIYPMTYQVYVSLKTILCSRPYIYVCMYRLCMLYYVCECSVGGIRLEFRPGWSSAR